MMNITIAVPELTTRTKALLWLAAYAIGWLLTYGHTWNHYECLRHAAFSSLCGGDRILVSTTTAIIWPIYWGLEGAKFVTG